MSSGYFPELMMTMTMQRPESMLTFENQQIQGRDDIIEKLSSLPFTRVAHQLVTLDAQPSTLPSALGASSRGGILVMVTGALLVDEEQRVMNYSQLFQLLPDEGSSYWVFNDVFRLVYAGQ
ncbi:MAG: hypothetical protein LQ347_002143 [Umbilicaria vellea]|nr:MAG: hypothetical protein LQ347_002143 [Umbilicaria vellea]